MQHPDKDRVPQGKNADSVENSYIKQLPSGGISFKTLLIALIAILCVSLIVMICLLGALNQRNEAIDNRREDDGTAFLSFGESVTTATPHQSAATTNEILPATGTGAIIVGVDVPAVTETSSGTTFAGGPENPIPPIEAPDMLAVFTKDTVKISEIRSEYAILVDPQKNTVIAHKNGDARMYPASMTKVMTLIVAYENIKDMNEYYTITAEMTDPPYLAGASVAGFKVGEKVRFIDIMYGIALPSGADATSAVAFKIAGSEAAFAELMNEKAKQLGLVNTHFVNASGLHHPDHYTTPREMEKIFEYAMSIPLLEEIMSTYMYRTEPTEHHPRTAPVDAVMTSENITDDSFGGLLLVSTMFSRMTGKEPEVAEVIAGKTGYTLEGEHCLASCAVTPDGRRYILVTGKATPLEFGKYGAVYDAIDIYKKYIPQS